MRHAHGDAVETGRRQFGNGTIGRLRQDQRQRSGPKRLGEARRIGIEARERLRRLAIGHMRDQRIEGRTAFGGIEPRHGFAIRGIGAEPINGLGGKGDKAARRKAAHRSLDRGGVGRGYPCHQAGLSSRFGT